MLHNEETTDLPIEKRPAWPSLKEGNPRMNWKKIVQIIEGKLYGWAVMSKGDERYPGPTKGKPTDEPYIDRKLEKSDSQQEAFLIRHRYEIWEWNVINTTLKKSPEELQRLVKSRYVDDKAWLVVAEELNVGERQAFRLRDNIILLLAYELGLLKEGDYQELLKTTVTL